MIKYGLALFLVIGMLTGCNQDSRSKINTAEVPTNHLGNDPSVLSRDKLAQIGDLGVESELKSKNPQHKGASVQSLNSKKLPPRSFVNPSILPLQGGYVENVISAGMQYLGTPYEFGSDRDTTTTFDCSDFTRWVFLSALGLELPSDSRSQAQYVEAYSPQTIWNIRDAKRGDLLFFMSYKGSKESNYLGFDKTEQPITHVGIYLGDGRMLHTMSPDTGGVRIDDVFDRHFEWRFIKGGSVLP